MTVIIYSRALLILRGMRLSNDMMPFVSDQEMAMVMSRRRTL